MNYEPDPKTPKE